ncbi:BON domain-containing protein [Rubripirellula amarantea]|nr:BON domain-containing protein [Rubripirellula amarantea]
MARSIWVGTVQSGWPQADDSDPFYGGSTDIATPAPSAKLGQLIRDRILQRLNQRVSELEVEVTANGVVLSGRCASFHTKQLAQHAAQGLLNNEPLSNCIEVSAS